MLIHEIRENFPLGKTCYTILSDPVFHDILFLHSQHLTT